ncbi:hypothetical protein H696_03583 [Fonticula alba]|uniref:WW domain-containing protein n=1 Tax=Fonticula alba TaxID=691883 RepID=A0A058Z9C9_FONAL|nr:hypothetical protein H696_03583 [Fonticula alba]KCV70122.1 hypothetical protein H696_03583 [Fonticula alba]|eukprot:XP_009495728.1 hypothetical protein H696_03583 [Fonticula alba]
MAPGPGPAYPGYYAPPGGAFYPAAGQPHPGHFMPMGAAPGYGGPYQHYPQHYPQQHPQFGYPHPQFGYPQHPPHGHMYGPGPGAGPVSVRPRAEATPRPGGGTRPGAGNRPAAAPGAAATIDTSKPERPISQHNLSGTEWRIVNTSHGRRYFFHVPTKQSHWSVPAEIRDAVIAYDIEKSGGLSDATTKASADDKDAATGTNGGDAEDAPDRQEAAAAQEPGVTGAEVQEARDSPIEEPDAPSQAAGDLEDASVEDDFDEAAMLAELEAEADFRDDWEEAEAAQAAAVAASGPGAAEVAQPQSMAGAFGMGHAPGGPVSRPRAPHPADRYVAFKEMLRDRGVSPFADWAMEIPHLMADPRYHTVPSLKEKKKAFDQYCREVSRSGGTPAVAAAPPRPGPTLDEEREFQALIREHEAAGRVTAGLTSFRDFSRWASGDPRFGERDVAERLFEDFQNEARRKMGLPVMAPSRGSASGVAGSAAGRPTSSSRPARDPSHTLLRLGGRRPSAREQRFHDAEGGFLDLLHEHLAHLFEPAPSGEMEPISWPRARRRLEADARFGRLLDTHADLDPAEEAALVSGGAPAPAARLYDLFMADPTSRVRAAESATEAVEQRQREERRRQREHLEAQALAKRARTVEVSRARQDRAVGASLESATRRLAVDTFRALLVDYIRGGEDIEWTSERDLLARAEATAQQSDGTTPGLHPDLARLLRDSRYRQHCAGTTVLGDSERRDMLHAHLAGMTSRHRPQFERMVQANLSSGEIIVSDFATALGMLTSRENRSSSSRTGAQRSLALSVDDLLQRGLPLESWFEDLQRVVLNTAWDELRQLLDSSSFVAFQIEDAVLAAINQQPGLATSGEGADSATGDGDILSALEGHVPTGRVGAPRPRHDDDPARPIVGLFHADGTPVAGSARDAPGADPATGEQAPAEKEIDTRTIAERVDTPLREAIVAKIAAGLETDARFSIFSAEGSLSHQRMVILREFVDAAINRMSSDHSTRPVIQRVE